MPCSVGVTLVVTLRGQPFVGYVLPIDKTYPLKRYQVIPEAFLLSEWHISSHDHDITIPRCCNQDYIVGKVVMTHKRGQCFVKVLK
jgi:hypothetical protein